jgi:hypothetical protein
MALNSAALLGSTVGGVGDFAEASLTPWAMAVSNEITRECQDLLSSAGDSGDGNADVAGDVVVDTDNCEIGLAL